MPLEPSGGPEWNPTPNRFHGVEAGRSHQRTICADRTHSRLRTYSKKNAPKGVHAVALVDLRGIEPLTSSMPRKCARAAETFDHSVYLQVELAASRLPPASP
jgi:hypothetical protein